MSGKKKIRVKVTDAMYERMQKGNPQWTREVYDTSEDIALQFKENILYLCEKKNITVVSLMKWVNEMGFRFRSRRLYEWGVEHAIYPSLLEITFFSKYFDVDPGSMISKDLREVDRLRGLKK